MTTADSGSDEGMTRQSESWLRRHGHVTLLVAFAAGAIVSVVALPRWASAPQEDAGQVSTSSSQSVASGEFNSDSDLSSRPQIEAYLEHKANELIAGVVGPNRARVLVGVDVDPGVATAGSIRRMTVSVLLDARSAASADIPWTVESLNSIRALVANALGVDETRGDEIAVLAIPFESGSGTEPRLASIVQHIEPLGKPLLALLGMALAFLLGLRATDAVSAHAAAVRGFTGRSSVGDTDRNSMPDAPKSAVSHSEGQPSSGQAGIPAYAELINRTSEDPGHTARALRAWMSRP